MSDLVKYSPRDAATGERLATMPEGYLEELRQKIIDLGGDKRDLTEALAAKEKECEELREIKNTLAIDAHRYRFLRDEENMTTADEAPSRWEMLGELSLGEFDSFIDEQINSRMYEPTDS